MPWLYIPAIDAKLDFGSCQTSLPCVQPWRCPSYIDGCSNSVVYLQYATSVVKLIEYFFFLMFTPTFARGNDENN